MTLNGVAVTAGQSVSVASINSGLLRFTPSLHANGTNYASFTFQVQDDGGTALGGVDLDPTANQLTIHVTAVNDAPTVATPATATVVAGTDYMFSVAGGNSVSVADVDAGTVRVSLAVAEGTLTLATTAGLTFTAGDGVGDMAIVFNGTLPQVNAALDGLRYTNAINYSGTDTLTISVSDLGNTGLGGTLQDSRAVALTVNTPSAPLTGDAFLAGNYLQVGLGADGALGSDGVAPVGFQSAGARLGVEVDPERDGWSTYDGDFILSGTPEETWGVRVAGTTYSNSNVQSPQITGNLSNFQSTGSAESVDWTGAVAGLGVDTTYVVSADSQYIDVAVTLTNTTGAALNDVYYYRNVDPDNNYLQGSSDQFKTTNTVVSQGNNGSGVAFVKAVQADGSYLGLMGFGDNARVSYGGFTNRDPVGMYAGTGVYTQSGSHYSDEAVSLAFKIDTIAAGASETLHYRYYFAPASEPTIDLDPNDSGSTSGANYSTTFVEGAGPVAVTDADATVFDADSATLSGMTIRITNLLDGAAESLAATTTGNISASFSGNTLTLSGTDSVANYRQVLRSIQYNNTSLNPDSSLRIITIQATDGVHSSNVATTYLTIDAVNNAPTITSPAAVSVAENAVNVLTVTSSDPDGSARLYSITGGADSARFSISSTTGQLQFLTGPDFEAPGDSDGNNVYDVQVTANDQRGGTATQLITVTVTDVDEFDVSPIMDTNVAADNVTENVAVGTPVGVIARSTDGDGTTNTITYSLDDSAGGQFAIGASSGVVTVAGSIDREVGATRTIVVRATSADGSTTTRAFTITVNDVDEFDVVPISDANAAIDNVTENAVAGTLVGITAQTSDADATTNAITYSLDNSAGGQFAIGASSGVVTVAGSIDRESGATRTIVVRATSADGSWTTQAYTITVNDVDEFDVTPIADTNGAANNVTENALAGALVGITASSTDGDATTNAISYSLDDDAGGQFAIGASSGVVTVAGAIDREAGATRTIVVRATSADGSTTTRAFTITVNDVDEFDVVPISDANAAIDNVTENAVAGTLVGITAQTSDADATTNAITYSLDNSAGGQFAIGASSGVVTVAGSIDREAGATRTIVVRATSADGSWTTQAYTITVNDVDEFDVTPIADTNGAANNVTENAACRSLGGHHGEFDRWRRHHERHQLFAGR
ncbi:MAG: cadherin domain-containing protein [Pirellulales bacterium]